MNWVDIIVIIIFILSVIAGVKEGAPKHIFSLVTIIIAIPITGALYLYLANLLSFIPGTNWENFLGFFIIMGIVSVLLQLIFWVPRKILQKAWGSGIIYRVVGGAVSLLGACISLALFALVLKAYPIFDWLAVNVSGSSIISGLMQAFGFIQLMLPEALQTASRIAAATIA